MGTMLKLTVNGKNEDGTPNITAEVETWKNPLPCPFCGSKEVLWQNNYKPYSVFCRNCGARIDNYGNKRQCLDDWNRRAKDEQ